MFQVVSRQSARKIRANPATKRAERRVVASLFRSMLSRWVIVALLGAALVAQADLGVPNRHDGSARPDTARSARRLRRQERKLLTNSTRTRRNKRPAGEPRGEKPAGSSGSGAIVILLCASFELAASSCFILHVSPVHIIPIWPPPPPSHHPVVHPPSLARQRHQLRVCSLLARLCGDEIRVCILSTRSYCVIGVHWHSWSLPAS